MKQAKFLIIIFLFISCEFLEIIDAKDDEDPCVVNGLSLIDDYYSSNYYSFYDNPVKGLGCSEFKKRKRRTQSNNSNSCAVSMATQDTEAQDVSKQNTVIEGVQEARTSVKNKEYYFLTEERHLFIYNQVSTSLEVSIDLKMKNNKMILRNNNLIILGESGNRKSLKFFDIKDIKNLVLKKRFNFDSNISMTQSGDVLYLKEVHYNSLPESISCEDIKYLGEGEGMPLSLFYNIGLESMELVLTEVYYGNIEQHIDVNNTYHYSKSHDSTLIINPQKNRSTEISGLISGKFSLKEKDDHLLIFTQKKRASNLTVLDQHLEYVYNLNGIAPGEDIYAVKFKDDRAYLVTFETVDPLFSFDISNVRSPKLLDELKVPGFSRYMNILNESRLLTFGKTSGSWYSNVEINLYDSEGDLEKLSGFELEGIHNLSLFRDHHKLEIHNEYLFVQNYDQVIVLKIDRDEVIDYRRIQLNSSYGDAVVMGYKNELRIFENGVLKRYHLEDYLDDICSIEE